MKASNRQVSGITVVLVGKEFWRRVIDWQLLEDNGFSRWSTFSAARG